MFGDNFILKTMVAVFSLPLVAHADINVDFKPLTEYISTITGVSEMDTEHMVVAARTLNATVQMNMPVATTPEEEAQQKTDKQHFKDLLNSIETLHAQQQRAK